MPVICSRRFLFDCNIRAIDRHTERPSEIRTNMPLNVPTVPVKEQFPLAFIIFVAVSGSPSHAQRQVIWRDPDVMLLPPDFRCPRKRPAPPPSSSARYRDGVGKAAGR